MIVLAHGPDSWTVRTAVDGLLASIDPDRLNTSPIDGASLPFDQIMTQAGTPGFMGSGRVLVVTGLMAKASKAANASDPDDESTVPATPAGSMDFAALFGRVIPGNTLILVDLAIQSIPAAIKKVAPKDARVISGEPPRGHELVAWMQAIVHRQGGAIDVQTARMLAELLFPGTWSNRPANPRYDRPPDLESLQSELNKLALFAHPDPIQRRHVVELTAGTVADRLFPFLDALMSGRMDAAVAELQKLRDGGDDLFRVVAQANQTIELATVLEAAPHGTTPSDVGTAIGLSNPARMANIARSNPRRVAHRALPALAELDRAIKNGKLRTADDVIYSMIALFGAELGANERGNR